MKTKLFISLFISFFYYNVLGQVFPLENANWTELLIFEYELLDGASQPENQYISYSIQGDTIVDDVKRSKLYYSSNVAPNNSILIGFIHTDEGKVYFRQKEDIDLFSIYLMLCKTEVQDILLYDFTLAINDPLKTPCDTESDLFLSEIDFIPLGNAERKRYHFIRDNIPSWKKEWVEGMGSTLNLFDPIEIIMADGYYKKLICFSMNNEVLWLSPDFSDCSPHTGKPEPIKTASINIYPNPMNDALLITSSIPLQRIQIYNTNGGLLQDYDANVEFQYFLKKQTLSDGTYVVKITLQNGDIKVEKIIIN